MTTFKFFIKRRPVLTFYALAFAISWGGVLMIVGGPGAIPGTAEQVERLLPFAMLAWLAGPSVAGLLLTALVDGRAGLRDLRARMTKWRVGARWYAVAILTAPLLYGVVLLALSQFSPDFLPGIVTTSDKVGLLLFGITWGLIGGGFLEELGWTGFATPRLRQRYGILTTGLIVGVLWGAVHFSVIFWMSGGAIGGVPLARFLTVRGLDLLVGGLVAFRVLMVWVYDRTGGSLLVAMLMHATLTASMLILGPPAIAGVVFLTYCLAISVATWVVVGGVAIANRGQISRPGKPAIIATSPLSGAA
ncbi:MAG: CPBP family intramembrane metalloprotease [Caldilineaceae bacterium]|nr:CPBP family intramembrane metalloprotease [Caldilineaceae bacterium]